jgi:predicted transcriptional regulator
MNLGEIQNLIQAKILTNEANLEVEIQTAMASDLMSDVLSYCCPDALLITSLKNSQAIRTAEVSDLAAIVFTRNKRPADETIAMAQRRGINIFVTELPTYEVCGILYTNGITGI